MAKTGDDAGQGQALHESEPPFPALLLQAAMRTEQCVCVRRQEGRKFVCVRHRTRKKSGVVSTDCSTAVFPGHTGCSLQEKLIYQLSVRAAGRSCRLGSHFSGGTRT
eukprot:scaffold18065_cov111-Isochrysis_galbana.AAC.2